jgi:hypothetical protein
MSSEIVHGLYKQLLGLAEDQLNALHEERFDEALEYLEKRQRIIDEIQNLDATGINYRELKDISQKIRINIEKIISIDTENQNFLKTELNSISHRLEAIQKAKTFCSDNTYHQAGNTLNISA